MTTPIPTPDVGTTPKVPKPPKAEKATVRYACGHTGGVRLVGGADRRAEGRGARLAGCQKVAGHCGEPTGRDPRPPTAVTPRGRDAPGVVTPAAAGEGGDVERVEITCGSRQ